MEGLLLHDQFVNMVRQRVGCLVLRVPHRVHSGEEEAVAQGCVAKRVYRVKANEVFICAKLLDFEVLGPTSVSLLPQWELDVRQSDVGLCRVED